MRKLAQVLFYDSHKLSTYFACAPNAQKQAPNASYLILKSSFRLFYSNPEQLIFVFHLFFQIIPNKIEHNAFMQFYHTDKEYPMFKIAICEDDIIHTQIIKNLTDQFFHTEYEVSTFPTGTEFLNSLKGNACPYDIIMMDIELGQNSLSGISLAEKINQMNPDSQIIFISQYLQYASAVYEAKHIYFVAKDQIQQYLPKALHTAIKNLDKLRGQYLHFSIGARKIQIPQSEILYMERIMRITEIHTRTEIYSAREKLSELLLQLPSAFCLCHRSFAVNLRSAASLTRKDITFADGSSIPVGRTYYDDVKKAFAMMIMQK